MRLTEKYCNGAHGGLPPEDEETRRHRKKLDGQQRSQAAKLEIELYRREKLSCCV